MFYVNLKNYEMPHGGGILHAQIFVAEGETLKFKHSYAFLFFITRYVCVRIPF